MNFGILSRGEDASCLGLSPGLQVYRRCLLWGKRYIYRTYFGLLGASELSSEVTDLASGCPKICSLPVCFPLPVEIGELASHPTPPTTRAPEGREALLLSQSVRVTGTTQGLKGSSVLGSIL